MLYKDQEITLLIQNTGINGEGIARHEGKVIFIPYALTGEKVRAKIILIKEKYAVAKLLEVLTPAEERTRIKCSVFYKCGGCQLQHIRYCNQLKLKTKNVQDCFEKIAGLNPEINICVKSNFTFNYRNKLSVPVGDREGLILIGFYSAFSHNIVPIEKCPLHPDWVEKLIAALKDFMQACQIRGYNEEEESGVIRHLVARELSGQILITLVINADSLNCDYFIKSLIKIFPHFGLYLNINKKKTNKITGEKYIHIYGKAQINDEYNGLKYSIGPGAFMQINNSIKDKLYYKIIDLLKSKNDTVAIDAFSGTGLLAAHMTKHCKKVYTIEVDEQSYNSAQHLKKVNNIGDVMENILGDCNIELPLLLKKLKNEKVTLLLDPPRKGCDKEIIKAILKYKPQNIMYVSCNPATLARDIGYICGTLETDKPDTNPNITKFNNLYEISLVQPYDMFPQTKHVETLVVMSRK